MRRRPIAASDHVPQAPVASKAERSTSPPQSRESRPARDALRDASAPSDGPTKSGKDHDDKDSRKQAPAPRATVTERLGIWEIEREVYTWRDYLPFSRLIDDWIEIQEALPFVVRFIRELLQVGPLWALLYAVLRLAQAFLPAYRMKSRANALKIAHEAVNTREVGGDLILWIFAQQAVVILASRCLQWSIHHVTNALSYRLRRIFEVHMMTGRFNLDLPSLEDENVRRHRRILNNRGSTRAWTAMQALFDSGAHMIEVAAAFGVLLGMLRENRRDRWIAYVALLRPLLDTVVSDQYYTHNYWSRIVDSTARRVDNLRTISLRDVFFKDILAFSLGPYITHQFIRGSDELNSKQPLLTPHNRIRSPLAPGQLLRDISEDLTLIVFALQAIRTPKDVPVNFVTYQLIKQTTQDFSRRVIGIGRGGRQESLAQQAGMIRSVYEAIHLPTMITDGDVEYVRGDTGMDITLKNVSFAYAGAAKPVLHNISMVIPRGSFVCIVGSNGSGKSTLMKLLTRLWDPTEGEILVNGRSIKDYRIDSLRIAIAALWQDHTILPLTLRENIGIGKYDEAHDHEAVRRAAVRAGCADFIEDLPKGFDTDMAPPDLGGGRVRGFNMFERRPGFLNKGAAEQERQVQLSGGQMQKVALARVLMREEQVDLMLFDEPTASLDARAERELFLRVQSVRGTKTIIWVSHRLHLARHADLVVMIDRGRITEMGPPDELLAKGGSFSELYDFQT